MKSFPLRIGSLLVASVCVGILPSAAQTTPSTAPTPQNPPSKGQVIFSRSIDANGQTTPPDADAGAQAPPQVELAAPQVPQVAITSYDLDVHLLPEDQRIAVRAVVTVRNDGKTPLTEIPLQISSSLDWEEIRVDGAPGQNAGHNLEGRSQAVAFQGFTLNSDTDHTGRLHEAEIPLGQPLRPGQNLQLDVTYSGQIAPSAQRLQSLGAPDAVALHSDWDQIGVDFTGLRGFGNVVWYPVVSVPVLLGDGARLFDELGAQKLRLSGARFRLRLVDEFPHGQAPTVAVVNGYSVPLIVTEPGSLDQSREVDGVATASLDSAALGFEAPSLFVAIRTPHTGTNLTAWTLPDDNVSVQFWTAEASAVTPFIEGWLGQKTRSPLTLLDLPDPQDAPFETGALLAAPLLEPGVATRPGGLEEALVHALSRAWLTPSGAPPPAAYHPSDEDLSPGTPVSHPSDEDLSPGTPVSHPSDEDLSPGTPVSHPSDEDLSPGTPVWLDEGVATFMTTLWVEKQQGRTAALQMLEADRAALALAEPASPGESAGQPLDQAISPVYYRTKAAYVLWMLRDLAGDPALSAALSACDRDSAASGSFEKLLEASANHPDLGWFFADWVDADKGLPDLSITGVYPSPVEAGNWLVAVDLANAGYAAAEIPLIVRARSSSGQTSVTRRVLVPARGRITERILIQGKPTSVQANDGTVPETEAGIHITHLDAPAGASADGGH